jgi:undecaprenyl diphosphate synthase
MTNQAATPLPELRQAPRHVAIIMDGNHRWARRRHLPGAAGHRAGARAVRPVAECAARLGIEVLTLFAFSTENWHRPKREVSLLIALMKRVLSEDVQELHAENIRVRIIGDRSRFDPEIQRLMREAEALTMGNSRMTLMIAANYGGRWDIVNACRTLAERVRAGQLAPEQIDEAMVDAELSLAGFAAPDLCIRTGGDHRISNFLLWQFAYTELYFTDVFWPDFDGSALSEAVDDYDCRQRRFGRRVDDD